jgi:crotonobetainyl-CoA:carnitine CoA-transferase CaiB-like acyl-CoA transferase
LGGADTRRPWGRSHQGGTPGTGDDTRAWGPPWLKDPQGRETGESAYFLCANRNKKSLTVDIKHSGGQELVRELARRSDVLIENYKVDGLKQYGLDYEALRQINPRLIYCFNHGVRPDGSVQVARRL